MQRLSNKTAIILFASFFMFLSFAYNHHPDDLTLHNSKAVPVFAKEMLSRDIKLK